MKKNPSILPNTCIKKYFFTLIVFAIGLQTNAQKVHKDYFAVQEKAWSQQRNKEYCNAADAYSMMAKYGSELTLPDDAFNAACCFAKCAKVDEAFKYLTLAVKKGKYHDVENFTSRTDLDTLKKYPQWNSLVGIVKKNKINVSKDYKMEWVNFLVPILETDQKFRVALDTVKTAEGNKYIWKLMNTQDSINQILVSDFIDKNGWPETKFISADGRDALFYVIQHGDSELRNKYIKIIKKASKRDVSMAPGLALMVDRMLCDEGKPQKYGSQFTQYAKGLSDAPFVFFPIKNKRKVNTYRRKMGLEPIEAMAKANEIVYP